MTRRGRGASTRPSPVHVVHSLTENQARVLREARDTEGGAYIGWGSFVERESVRLLDGDEPAATVREVPRTFEDYKTPGGVGHYTDRYLVPTAYGLELLAADDARVEAEKSRREARFR